MTEPSAAPALRRRELAHALRQLREDTGLRATEVTSQLGFSPSKLSRIETGNRPIGLDDLQRLCRLYQVDEAEYQRLAELAIASRQESRWRKLGEMDPVTVEFADLEDAATSIKDYKTSVITGLLQTPAYTSALMRGFQPHLPEYEIRDRVRARALRQEIVLARTDRQLEFVLDEAAIRRVVGGAQVMREQLLHLIELSRESMVSIRVVPFSAGVHPGMDSLFTILSFAEEVRDIVYVDSLAGIVTRSETAEIQRYRAAFSRIDSLALTASDTRLLLTRAAHEMN
ncbi:helix-turn-helix domain-containing protein [Cryptosporangium phraense]|uniref:Helix-turn-helix domain-containing protein n=1 Tax=Cryptosporangium phraense TaxID=2593070 RepID=A0A545AFR1_9ACTN|nr:helix-turn-helix transcriptional regulator [Cryptosporangium phraense]TQS40163.1 helix-turn-helix domain-containing protein [Cryptosporangium phraense]